MEAVLEREVHERAENLQRAWEGAPVGWEAFFVRAVDTCQLVTLIQLLWGLLKHRLQTGGAARLIDKECAGLLEVARGMAPHLDRIAQDLPTKPMPQPAAQDLATLARQARDSLAAVIDAVERLRAQLNRPPRITAGVEEVRQRIRDADENKRWLPLREVIARMEDGGSKEA